MLDLMYVSVGVNRSPHCIDWSGDEVIYAAGNAVVLAKSHGDSLECVDTMVSHTDKVNSVSFVSGSGGTTNFVSSSTDGTAVFWSSFAPSHTLKGHEGSVSVAVGVQVDEGGNRFLVASASSDSTIKVWSIYCDREEYTLEDSIAVAKSGFANALRVHAMDGAALLFAATDDCNVHIYGKLLDGDKGAMRKLHSLRGHEDWVQCLDLTVDRSGDLLLASGGQDSFIRMWRFHRKTNGRSDTGNPSSSDGELKLKEEVIEVSEGLQLSVSLESVLAGHEDKVFGLRWQKSPNSVKLLSCSMDKSLILWTLSGEEDDSDGSEGGGIWNETVRVGEVGGNTLGFLGCAISLCGSYLVGYSFTGSLHLWKNRNDDWEPSVVPGGHFGPVEDLDWDINGRYLITVSSDQTTRVHVPWKQSKQDGLKWHEVARPQVHGHDLTCVTALPGHRFASGADEKIVRVFESTKMFLRNLASITGFDDGAETFSLTAHGASVPSLGLSNKAVFEGDVGGAADKKQREEERHVKDLYPDHYFTPEDYSRPPTEEALAQNTLWPELQKLYGHGYEIFTLASSGVGGAGAVVVASACKASNAEHAEVILWTPKEEGWKINQRLPGHGLTVTAMSFSPDGRYLLTASRDRTWCLYLKSEDGTGTTYRKVHGTSKKNSVHQRLIWACDWSPDSKYFVTSSRDKKVATWAAATGAMACEAPLLLGDSVTAVSFHRSGGESSGGGVSYTLAAGLDDGTVHLIEWNSESGGWRVLHGERVHHKTVRRLRFRPGGAHNDVLLASCSSDHSVKLHKVHINR